MAQFSSEYGIHPNQLYRWKKQGVSQFHEVFEDRQKDVRQLEQDQHKKLDQLYAEIGRLTTQVNWLKKNLALNRSKSERKKMIEFGHPELSLSVQADLLGLSRSGLYYQPGEFSAREIYIKHRIDEIYTRWPFYGSRRITNELQKGMMINRKTVQKYMREMGLAALGPRPNLSKPHPGHKIYPYLLRNVTAAYPNHIWGIDITYIRLRDGWMYLTAVMDWYSRFVISWALDQTLAVFLFWRWLTRRCRGPYRSFGTAIRAANSPTRSIFSGLKIVKPRSVWTEGVVRRTIFLLSACGVLSKTRRFIYKITRL